MEAIILPIRVLYTINSSPQYILARSHRRIAISPVHTDLQANGDHPTSSHSKERRHDVQRPVLPAYATVPLKVCLDIVCRSSPELLQFRSRDFSIYVLDPLESCPYTMHAPFRDASSPSINFKDELRQDNSDAGRRHQGMAVGMGLLSWALLTDEDESVTVTGTIIKTGHGDDTLEVIFALRETGPMQNSSFASRLRYQGRPYQSDFVTSSQESYRPVSSVPEQFSSSQFSQSSPISQPINLCGLRGGVDNSECSQDEDDQLRTTKADIELSGQMFSLSEGSATSSVSSVTAEDSPEQFRPTQFAKSTDWPTLYIGPPKPARGRRRKAESNRAVLNTKEIENGHVTEVHNLPPALVRAPLIRASITPSIGPDLVDMWGTQTGSTHSGSPSVTPCSISRKNLPPEERFNLVEPQVLNANGSARISRFDDVASIRPSVAREPVPSSKPALQSLLSGLSSTDARATLLSILSAIDSSVSETSSIPHTLTALNPALVKGLSDLLSSPDYPFSNALASDANSGRRQTPLAPTFSPTMYTKEKTKDDEEIVCLDKENVDPHAFRRKSSKKEKKLGTPEDHRRSDPLHSSISSRRSINSEALTFTGRKRTLSEYMDGSDHSRDNGDRQHRTSKENRSNGGRLSTRSDPIVGSALWPRKSQSITSGPTVRAFLTASQSSFGTSSNTSESRKRYKVPDWAKTTAPTQPRMAHRTSSTNNATVSKKATVRKSSSRKSKRALVEIGGFSKSVSRETLNSVETNGVQALPDAISLSSTDAEGSVISRTASPLSQLPIFASSDPISSSLTLSPPSTPSHAPTTPVQRRRQSPYGSSNSQASREQGSPLFSPTPKRPRRPFSDHLLSPCPKSATDEEMSPIKSNPSARRLYCDSDFSIDESDNPPSSLPLMSSDVECEPVESTDVEQQHWSIGLPPSSPPPPSSPLLTPEDAPDDFEFSEQESSLLVCDPVDVADAAISQSHLDKDNHKQELGDPNSCVLPLPNEILSSMSSGDFNDIFADFNFVTPNMDTLDDVADPFGLSTNDPSQAMTELDFSEFWECMKPLMDQDEVRPQEPLSTLDVGVEGGVVSETAGLLQGDAGNVAHAQLTEELRSLFGGCLV